MKNDVFAALSQKSEKRSETSVRGLTEMFGLSGDIKVTTLSISSLKEKANHPFKVMTNDKLNALAESIKANGLMEPIIVRTLGEGAYEILAGHRRTRATQLNGETEIKAIVIKADDELSNRIMISTNFQQRDSYLPSEIARSYLIRYTDLKNRKKVKDKNSNGWNSEDKIDRIMENEFSTSKSKVYMYLRINHLVQELLDVLDGRRLSLKIAVELSYLSEEEQRIVNELVYQQRLYKLDLKKAVNIKQESARNPIDEGQMHKLLSDNPKYLKVDSITFSDSEIGEFKDKFKDMTHMKNAIIEFLKDY